MPTLSDEQVARLLKPAEVVEAIEEAFRRDYRATVEMPTRLQFDVPPTGTFLLMPCYDSETKTLGIKFVTVRTRPAPGQGSVQATYSLLDPETHEVKLQMAADTLTDIRTAAASAVATKILAREDASTLGIFGAGRQARAHLQVLAESRKFQQALVCGSSEANSKKFAREMAEVVAMPVEAANARAVAEQADVICTCTTASEPLFEGAWLKPGTHLNLVGAFQPVTREVDDETIRRARVFVDTYDGAFAEAGDILLPLKRGVITRDHVCGDLHELVSGKTAGRQSQDDITVFESLGCAWEDLIAARLVADAVAAQGKD